jgi:hypothetical protein
MNRTIVAPKQLISFNTFVRLASGKGVGVTFHRYDFWVFVREVLCIIGPCGEEDWWNLWEIFINRQDARGDKENVYSPSVQ